MPENNNYAGLINRDISWLRFNDRVLNEAADPAVPPLERLRFATIVSSNLDEFFMVRVAEIAQLARRYPKRAFPDGLSAAQTVTIIREHVLQQKATQAAVLQDIVDVLTRQGVEIHTHFSSQASALDTDIRKRLPELHSVIRASHEPLPMLKSERIHIFVRFPREYAVLTIKDRDARLIELPRSGRTVRYALAERWLCAKTAELFPGRVVIEAFPFKIIRMADLRYHPDDEDSLEEQIQQAVKRRSQAKIVRLELDAPSYTEGALFLATGLGVDSAALYRFDLPLDLRVLGRIYSAKRHQRLRYRPVHPAIPEPLRRADRLFDVVRNHDVLLHHPYDSFDIVVNFLKTAAADPRVTRISHTMYRTSVKSPVMDALKLAAKNGKKVAACVEVKARFDELNNVRWAAELRRAGVRVIRPFGMLKVHSKLTQVVRREDGADVYYTHLGTGNYHPTTARQYTDLGLLTADAALGREASSYFDSLARRTPLRGLRELLVAPRNLHARINKLIEQEIFLHRRHGGGRIAAKMNALVDPEIINALYRASAAGVKIDLLVRGICCLRPGVPGLSENIRVTSVIDRFLEHSRIYYFRAAGAEHLYLSSADWMPRNFFTRLEVAFPIKDPLLKRYIVEVILGQGLADNAKSWLLQPDGTYARILRPKHSPAIRSQMLFTELAQEAYRGTVLEHRIVSR